MIGESHLRRAKSLWLFIGSLLGISLLWFVMMLFLSAQMGLFMYIAVQIFLIGMLILNAVRLFKKKERRKPIFSIVSSLLLSILFFSIALLNAMTPYYRQYFYGENLALSPSGKLKMYEDMYKRIFLMSDHLNSFQRVKVKHILFYQEDHVNAQWVTAVLNGIAKEQKDYRRMFGSLPPSNVSVVFYSNKKQMGFHTPMIDLNGGYLPSKNRISIYIPRAKANDREYIEKISAHEYSHFLFHQFAKEHHIPLFKIPVWLNEGIARYIENRSAGLPLDEKILQDQPWIPLNKLDTYGNWHAHLDDRGTPYDQSALFVSDLLHKNGEKAFQRFLLNLKTDSWEDAFEKATHKRFEDEEADFVDRLNRARSLWNQTNSDLLKAKQAEALKHLNQLHHLFPGNSSTLETVAKIYMNQGLYRKALEYGTEAEKVNPNHDVIKAFLALVLIYIDPDKTWAKIQEMPLDVQYEKDLAEHIRQLIDKIHKGEPLRGYYDFVQLNDLNSDKNKLDLINMVLNKYPDGSRKYRTLLLDYKSQLEKRKNQ